MTVSELPFNKPYIETVTIKIKVNSFILFMFSVFLGGVFFPIVFIVVFRLKCSQTEMFVYSILYTYSDNYTCIQTHSILSHSGYLFCNNAIL